jgi:ribosomal-protein-alanine N-acetyltransferase
MKSENLRLEGKGVFLRRVNIFDRDELAARYKSSRRHLTGFSDVTFSDDRFEKMLEAVGQPASESFLICRTSDGSIVGRINLSQIFMGPYKGCFLGYELFSGFTGNGYMTEALRLVLGFAFGVRKLHRVEANVQPENAKSIAVLTRSGFSKEGFSRKYLKIGGRWRDHERWAIIREDWNIKVK